MKSKISISGTFASAALSASALFAQALQPPRLLKDIEPARLEARSSKPQGSLSSSSYSTSKPFLAAGSTFFFTADDGIHGREIWSSMGFPGTTRMAVDMVPGRNLEGPGVLTWFKGYVYFDGRDREHGTEIWRTKGTPATTYLFQDSLPGKESGGFQRPLVAGNRLWFFASSPGRNYALFRYDGSNAPPSLVKDGFSTPWSEPIALGGRVLFGCSSPGRPASLWITDGTERGTKVVLQGSSTSPHRFIQPVALGGRVYFSHQEARDWAVWKTDGSKAQKILNLGEDYAPWSPQVLGKKILFLGPRDKYRARNPWVLDTATGKASLLKRILQKPGRYFADPVRMGNRVYFTVQDRPYGPWSLWRTDGTPSGTVRVTGKGLSGTSSWLHPTVSGNRIFFQGFDSAGGKELWVTDGTDKGTLRVKDIAPGAGSSKPENLTPIGSGRIAFSAWSPKSGREVWVSDGTATGTYLLEDIYPGFYGKGSDPDSMADFYGRCFFSATNTAHGRELWVSDGTPAGTKIFHEYYPGFASPFPGGMFTLREKLLFILSDGNKAGVWASDGTFAGTTRISTTLRSWKESPLVLGGKAFLWGDDAAHGWEPWVTDGTAKGTMLLKDTHPGVQIQNYYGWAEAGGRVFFYSGDSGKVSLWVTDLTPAGTRIVAKDLGACRGLVALGNKVLFEGMKDSAHGIEPWISDGTTLGTHELLDLAPGSQSGRFRAPFVLGKNAYFFGTDGRTVASGYYGLFRTDGTKSGTARVGTRDFLLYPFRSFALEKKGFFWAKDASHGFEPWVTDGTAAGTRLLRDLAPGPDSTNPTAFMKTGKRKGVFVAYYPFGARRLLATDGTPGGTYFVPDPGPGKILSCSGILAFSGGKVFFGADDGSTGMEPWTWFPGATAQAVGWSRGGARLDGEDPVLGGKFRLTVTGMAKGTAGILVLGRPLSRPLLLGGGAALFLDPRARPLAGFPLGASGSLAFTLPGDPALIGARFAAQAVVGPTRTPPFHLDFTNGLFLTLGQ